MAGTGKGFKYVEGIKKIFLNIQKDGWMTEDKVFVELTESIGHATNIVQEYINNYNEKIVIYVVGRRWHFI